MKIGEDVGEPIVGLAVDLVMGFLVRTADDGDAVGGAVGNMFVGEKLFDGLALGRCEGREENRFVGVSDGLQLGDDVGALVGIPTADRFFVGVMVNTMLGILERGDAGTELDDFEGLVDLVGLMIGTDDTVGNLDGLKVGFL